MSYKQQISPWSIYDNFSSDKPAPKKVDTKQSHWRTPKNQQGANIKLNPAIQQILLNKDSDRNQIKLRQNKSQLFQHQITEEQSANYLISGGKMKYHSFRDKQSNMVDIRLPQKHLNKQSKIENYYKDAINSINQLTLVKIIVSQLQQKSRNTYQPQGSLLPKIHSNGLQYPKIDRRYNSSKEHLNIYQQQKRNYSDNIRFDGYQFKPVHIGNLSDRNCEQKVVKQLMNERIWQKEGLDRRFEFPNKKIKYQKDSKSANKILMDFYNQNEDFNDNEIHGQIEVAKNSIKKSKMKPIIIKQSNIPNRLKQFASIDPSFEQSQI